MNVSFKLSLEIFGKMMGSLVLEQKVKEILSILADQNYFSSQKIKSYWKKVENSKEVLELNQTIGDMITLIKILEKVLLINPKKYYLINIDQIYKVVQKLEPEIEIIREQQLERQLTKDMINQFERLKKGLE